MPSIRTQAPYDILVVTGNDVYSGPDDSDWKRLIDALYSGGNQTVSRGSHDLWFVYTADNNRLAVSHGWDDDSIQPRRFRGISQMGPVPSLESSSDWKWHLWHMVHEMTHHWLVPHELAIDGLNIPKTSEITRNLNEGEPIHGAPIKARQYLHWSSYVNTEGSIMDGTAFDELPQMSGYDVWQSKNVSPTILTGPEDSSGMRVSVPVDAKISSIDRYIIGLDTLDENYSLDYLDPKFISPCNFQSGLLIAFGNDYYYFGFTEDHRRLAVRDSDDNTIGDLSLDDNYYGQHRHDGVALRVVKKDREIFFQAKYDVVGHSGNRSGKIPMLFSDIGSVSSHPMGVPNESTFVTVAKIIENNTPTFIGSILRTWGSKKNFFVENSFYNIEILSDTESYQLTTNDIPAQLRDGGNIASAVRSGVLNFHDPSGESILRQRLGRLHIAATYAFPVSGSDRIESVNINSFVHEKDNGVLTDKAPKLVTKPPRDASFAFGTSCRLERSVIVPFASGSMTNPIRTVWGRKRSIFRNNIRIPRHILNRRINRGTELKCAFILIAQSDADVTEAAIEKLDQIRTMFDSALRIASQGDITSNSRLSGVVRVGRSVTIQQKSNGRFLDAHEVADQDFSVVTRSSQNNDTQRWLIAQMGDGSTTIRQKSSGRFLDAHEVADQDFSVVTRSSQNNDTQRWFITQMSDGSATIRQKSSGRFLDAHEIREHDFSVVTRSSQNNDTQRWLIVPS